MGDAPSSSEYAEINRRIYERREEVKHMIGDENSKRLDELEELYTKSSDETAAAAFQYGFRIATLFMVEVFTGDNKFAAQKTGH